MLKAVSSMTQGHPDKLCDAVAEAIVDEYMRRDPRARLDLAVQGGKGMLVVSGAARSEAAFDIATLAKDTYARIGYGDDVEVFVNVEDGEGLRPEAAVVNGYATRETRELLPRPLVFARALARRLDDLRVSDPSCSWMLPDASAQLLMEGTKARVASIVASHRDDIGTKDVQTAVLERVITPVLGDDGLSVRVNPFGPVTEAGLSVRPGASGRQPGADAYGGLIPHGDASPIGKDPRHPARAGALMARMAARVLVEEGLATAALVTVAYAPGEDAPALILAQGALKKSRGAKMDLSEIIRERFDFRPDAIAERFDLLRPIYRALAAHGHVGRPGLAWEEPVTR